MAVQNAIDTDFRRHLPDLELPRFTSMKGQHATEYANAFKSTGQPPWLHGLYVHWRKLFEEPYHGITNDGKNMNQLSMLASHQHVSQRACTNIQTRHRT
jgi:hypothetical protein